MAATETDGDDGSEEQAAAERVFDVATGHIGAAALHLTVKLGIPDLLAAGPRSVADLAAATETHPDALYRVLRTLAGLGVFKETDAKHFALTTTAEFLRTTDNSLRSMALWLSDPFHFRVYAESMHSLRTGKPAVEKTVGVPLFEHLARDVELSTLFNDAMTSVSEPINDAVVSGYDFGRGLVVDVGGGHGSMISAIVRHNPDVRGILYDVDHVIAGARERIASAGLADRLETVVGSFFDGVPPGGDVYVMKHVIHDWDDDESLTILRHVRAALEGNPDGRVVLLEAVIPPGNEPDLFKLLDFEVLVVPGGRERREDEFASLFARSGFELTRVIALEAPLSAIEARPVPRR